MAVTERSVTLAEPPEAALKTCLAALERAGFKKVQPDPNGTEIAVSKWFWTQWTPSKMMVSLRPHADGTEVVATGTATAQSLISAANHPSERMVKMFLEALGPR
jgi:hypothetical protein